MPLVRILMLIVGLLALAVVGFAVLRPDPDEAPLAESLPPPRERPTIAPVRAAPPPADMSPADASSPAEMTARETEEVVRRLQKEQENPQMMVPDEIAPMELAPPDQAPPVK